MQAVTSLVTFVIVCKARLHHLKETLPFLLADNPYEVIVVDYACPQNAGSWVKSNYPSVKVVRLDEGQSFNLARGRNFGAQHASGNFLCFVDADIKVETGFVGWMTENLSGNSFYRQDLDGGTRDPQTFGTAICEKSHFWNVEGYDELYSGWGGEDKDLYLKLRRDGCIERVFPHRFITAIPHDDSERLLYFQLKNKRAQLFQNRVYRNAKKIALALHDSKGELPRELREQIFSCVNKPVLAWDGKSPLDVVVSIETPEKKLGLPQRLDIHFRMGRRHKSLSTKILDAAARLRASFHGLIRK